MSRTIVGLVSFMAAAGPQGAMFRLMRQLRLRGHNAEIWFLYERSPCYRGQEGVRVILPKARLSLLDIPRLFFRLVRMLRAERPDAVVGFLPLANILGLAAAAACGVRLRIASQRLPASTFGRLMRPLDRLLGVRGIYSRIVCVSESVKESFARYPLSYRERLSVVHNGIEWLPSTLDKPEARAGLGLPPQWPLLVATGDLVQQKNYDLMVRVVATTPRVRLAIAGDGSLRAAIEQLARDLGAEERIHFLGRLEHGQVMDLLRAADGFIQTSFYEGQSNSTLEAMHEGLAIICSDIPMQRETVCDENGKPTAILVPLSDFEGWRAAVLQLRDRSAVALEGGRAKALVLRRFGLARMIDGFEEATGKEENQWVLVPGHCAVESVDLTP
jgi:glycosyltransferase involved in cell wall biosynthesis